MKGLWVGSSRLSVAPFLILYLLALVDFPGVPGSHLSLPSRSVKN